MVCHVFAPFVSVGKPQNRHHSAEEGVLEGRQKPRDAADIQMARMGSLRLVVDL
jgi:hypothetical protein